MPTSPADLAPETHRALGVALYNRTRDLLEIEGRSPAQDDELIDGAHASAWHWRQAGEAGNAATAARGHWLCSRVYAVLGLGESAVHHARRAGEIIAAGGEGIEDWDAAAVAGGDGAGPGRQRRPGRRRRVEGAAQALLEGSRTPRTGP